MIERSNDIREALIEVADCDDSESVIDRRVSFKNKTIKYAKQLGEINVVTLELQKTGCTLSDCRWALDKLLQAVTVGKSDSESPFYQCKLASTISTRTRLQYYQRPEFELGVTKV